MAAKTQWWKNGDHDEVVAYKPKGAKVHELCPKCNQAYGVHGKIGPDLVHPGDFVISLDGGGHEVERFNALVEAQVRAEKR